MTKDKADFFFVGYPKSGSTTFYYLLKAHPEFFSPEIKEPKFFGSDFHREMQMRLGKDYYQLVKSEDEYSALFRDGKNKIKGDFNPFNIFSTEAPQNILNYNPNAKLLISIREPISFLRSFHFQSLYSMIEDEPDFLKALSLEQSRRNNHNIPPYCHSPLYLYYSSLVEYKEHIKRYTDIFDVKNVKIILFDDIIKNEHQVYQDILQFLDAKNSYYIPPAPDRNPSHAVRFTLLRKIFLNPPIKKFLYTKIPRPLLPLAARISQKMFKKPQEKPFVSDEDIKALKSRFKPNVDEINSFLNNTHLIERDISALWGY